MVCGVINGGKQCNETVSSIDLTTSIVTSTVNTYNYPNCTARDCKGSDGSTYSDFGKINVIFSNGYEKM